jgi:pimeloyl-ACP methyl ester carboxylesterase
MEIIEGVGAALVLFILACGLMLLLRFLSQKRTLREIHHITPQTGPSCGEKVIPGDIEQWISIESANRKNPVLLFLHGGPGMPIPSGIGFRNRHKIQIQAFTLVFCDQRGAGKLYNPQIPEHSLNIEQFLSDTKALIDFLKDRFQTQSIFLAAHSWGTILAMNYIYRYPEDIRAYLAFEQIVNSIKADQIAYNWALEKCTSDNKLNRLKRLLRIGPPPDDHKNRGAVAKYSRNQEHITPKMKRQKLLEYSKASFRCQFHLTTA